MTATHEAFFQTTIVQRLCSKANIQRFFLKAHHMKVFYWKPICKGFSWSPMSIMQRLSCRVYSKLDPTPHWKMRLHQGYMPIVAWSWSWTPSFLVKQNWLLCAWRTQHYTEGNRNALYLVPKTRMVGGYGEQNMSTHSWICKKDKNGKVQHEMGTIYMHHSRVELIPPRTSPTCRIVDKM